jgi:hypothetical protein
LHFGSRATSYLVHTLFFSESGRACRHPTGVAERKQPRKGLFVLPKPFSLFLCKPRRPQAPLKDGSTRPSTALLEGPVRGTAATEPPPLQQLPQPVTDPTLPLPLSTRRHRVADYSAWWVQRGHGRCLRNRHTQKGATFGTVRRLESSTPSCRATECNSRPLISIHGEKRGVCTKYTE